MERELVTLILWPLKYKPGGKFIRAIPSKYQSHFGRQTIIKIQAVLGVINYSLNLKHFTADGG